MKQPTNIGLKNRSLDRNFTPSKSLENTHVSIYVFSTMNYCVNCANSDTISKTVIIINHVITFKAHPKKKLQKLKNQFVENIN